jgi:hypothetical protein
MTVRPSLALASGQADLDAPSRYLPIFLLPHKVNFGGTDVGMSGEFAHFGQSTVTMHLK